MKVVKQPVAEFDDHLMGNEKKSVCFLCAKLIEMFKIRYKAITFPQSQVKACLDRLRLTKKVNWDQNDIDYIVVLYKTGHNRQKEVFQNLD